MGLRFQVTANQTQVPGACPQSYTRTLLFAGTRTNALFLTDILDCMQVIYGDDPRKIFKIIDQNMDGSLTRSPPLASAAAASALVSPLYPCS